VRAAGWFPRKLLIAIGGMIALALIAAGALVALVDAGRFRPQIAAAVESATGRPLRIDGAVRLDLLPFLAIAVEDAGLVNPPGFSGPYLVRWRELTLGAKLGPLLRGRFELTRIRVTGAELRLERRADGVVNWAGLGGGSESGRDSALRLRSIDGLEVRDGALSYLDARDGTRLEFADVSADLPRWTPGSPLSIEAGLTWRPANSPPLPFALETALQWDGEPLLLRDTRVTLRWRASEEAQGLGVQLDAPRIEIASDPLNASGAPLELHLGSGRDALTVRDWRVATGDDGISIVADVALESASLRRLLDESGIGAPSTTDPGALGAWRLMTRLRAERGELLLEPLEIRLDATNLRGRASRPAGGPIGIELAGDRMDIGRYLEPADAPTPPFEFPTAALRSLQARATLTLDSATLGDARLEGVTLRLVGDAGGLRAGQKEQGAR
jgi:AsmA protein